ncbi:MAG TPA: hypothetical protein VK530_04220, partial [Candidatus Acidoferrum sp.]|nr:hypothetical protein [Candidatus Acidoferrum sp.]
MPDVKLTFTAETNAAALAVQNFARNVESSVQQLGSAMLAALSARAITAFIGRMAEATDAAGKTAEKVGVSVEEFSKLSAAMRMENVEAGKFISISRELLNWMKDNGQAGRSFTEVLLEQADAIASIESPALRAAKATEVFGRLNGLDMIPLLSQGSEKLRERIEAMERIGVVTEEQARLSNEYSDALFLLGEANQSLGRALAVSLMPSLTAITNGLTQSVAALSRFVNESTAAQKAVEALTVAITALATAVATKAIASFAGFAAIGTKASSALFVLGAAITGWKIGEAVGEIELFGITINNRVTATILAATLAWEKFKQSFGTGDIGKIAGLEKELAKLLFKTAEAVQRKPVATKDTRLTVEEMEKERKEIDEQMQFIEIQEESFKVSLQERGGIPTRDDIAQLRDYNEQLQTLVNRRTDLIYKTTITDKEARPFVDKDMADKNELRENALGISDPNSFTEQFSKAF